MEVTKSPSATGGVAASLPAAASSSRSSRDVSDDIDVAAIKKKVSKAMKKVYKDWSNHVD